MLVNPQSSEIYNMNRLTERAPGGESLPSSGRQTRGMGFDRHEGGDRTAQSGWCQVGLCFRQDYLVPGLVISPGGAVVLLAVMVWPRRCPSNAEAP